MLTHETMGPTTAGNYLVVYQTPGCDVPTVACVCRTPDQAASEADRLNKDQVAREKCLQADRLACGLSGVYQGLEAAS